MIRLSTLPSAREQAHRVLTLLGVPTSARMVVDVHGGLFDGDLTVAMLAGLLRDEERTFGTAGRVSAYHLCRGLDAHHLTPAHGLVALSTWPLPTRIITRPSARVDALTATVRVAEFVAVRPGASGDADRLLRRLAADVPGGPEVYDPMNPRSLADAARAALAEPRLTAAVAADLPVRRAAAARVAQLDERHRLFGLAAVPRQSRNR